MSGSIPCLVRSSACQIALDNPDAKHHPRPLSQLWTQSPQKLLEAGGSSLSWSNQLLTSRPLRISRSPASLEGEGPWTEQYGLASTHRASSRLQEQNQQYLQGRRGRPLQAPSVLPEMGQRPQLPTAVSKSGLVLSGQRPLPELRSFSVFSHACEPRGDSASKTDHACPRGP